MIAHHDDLWGVPPNGDHPLPLRTHLRREVLEDERRRRELEGWTEFEIRLCRACAEHMPLDVAV